MAQHDRKDREQRGDTERSLQSTREGRELSRRDPFSAFWNDPFSFFQHDLWPFRRELSPWRGSMQHSSSLWSPQIETFQRGDQYIVRADLPGLNKDDVNVEVTENTLTIQGERREERQDEREGYYRSERSYGSFYRMIPLPEGAIGESAKATFNNGVLEVAVQAPPHEVSRRRRIEISDSSGSRSQEKEHQNKNANR